jgi:hypothetical protein
LQPWYLLFIALFVWLNRSWNLDLDIIHAVNKLRYVIGTICAALAMVIACGQLDQVRERHHPTFTRWQEQFHEFFQQRLS